MEFDASQILVALLTGVGGYIVNKIERVRELQTDLKKDLDAAFRKIRELEKGNKNDSDSQQNGHVSSDETAN